MVRLEHENFEQTHANMKENFSAYLQGWQVWAYVWNISFWFKLEQGELEQSQIRLRRVEDILNVPVRPSSGLGSVHWLFTLDFRKMILPNSLVHSTVSRIWVLAWAWGLTLHWTVRSVRYTLILRMATTLFQQRETLCSQSVQSISPNLTRCRKTTHNNSDNRFIDKARTYV